MKITPKHFALFSLVLLAALTLPDRSTSRLLTWPWHLYLQFFCVLPWLALGLFAMQRPLPRFGGFVDAIFGVFAIGTVASAALSPFAWQALPMLPLALAPVGFAYGTLLFLRWDVSDAETASSRAESAIGVLSASLGVVAFVSLAWWAASDFLPRFFETRSVMDSLHLRNERMLGHSSHVAGFGLLLLSLAAGQLVFGVDWLRRSTLWALAVLGLLVTLSAGARSGFFGVGVLALWIVFSFAQKHKWPFARIGWLTVACLGVCGVLALLHPRTRGIIENFQASSALSQGDVQRAAMLDAGLRMIKDEPVLGFGPGAVPLAYANYRAELIGGVEAALQLHSAPLHAAAEIGLPAAAAICVLWVGALVLHLISQRKGRASLAASIAATALAAYGAHALFDAQFEVPLFVFSAAALIAVLIADLRSAAVTFFPKWLAIFPALAVGAFAALLWKPLEARAVFSEAVDAFYLGEIEKFKSGAQAAIAADPENIYYRNASAFLVGDPVSYLRREKTPTGDLVFAVSALEASLAKNPQQEIAHFNLGWLKLGAQSAAAAEHFRAAARLVPDKGGVYFGLAVTELVQGKRDRAIAALSLELMNDPSFAISPVWREAAFAPLRDPALRRAEDRLGVARFSSAENFLRTKPTRYVAALFRFLRTGIDADFAALQKTIELPDARRFLEEIKFQELRDACHPDTPQPDGALVMFRRERTAYGLLLRNLEAPPPRDFYMIVQNAPLTSKYGRIFPVKGWLTGPDLVAEFSELER